MEFKIPPLWQIVLILIFIPMTWVVLWFLLALLGHVTGIPVPSVADTSALLSIVGSIMGQFLPWVDSSSRSLLFSHNFS